MQATEEITLTIRPNQDGSWTVTTDDKPPQEVSVAVPLGFERVLQLRERVHECALKCRRTRQGATRHANAESDAIDRELDQLEQELEQAGRTLFGCLMQGAVIECYRERAEKARNSNPPLPLRLRLCSDEPLVMAMPWELLFDTESHNFIAPRNRFALVRSGARKLRPTPPPVRDKLRVLIVVSDTAEDGFDSLDWGEELEAITACLDMPDEIELRVVSGNDTARQLEEVIAQQHRPHVLHFIGHGQVDERTGEGSLIFRDASGRASPVTARKLTALIGEQSGLRLVVLNSCSGTATSPQRSMAAVAASLFRQRIPAVIAMQTKVLDTTAREFARLLYSGIAVGDPLDTILTWTRRELRDLTRPESPEWMTPVLFLDCIDADVIGLSITPDILLKRAQVALREGRWQMSAGMAEALRRRSLSHAMEASNLHSLAIAMKDFADATFEATSALGTAAPDRQRDLVLRWTNAALAVDVRLLRQIAGADGDFAKDVERAQKQARALNGGRYEVLARLRPARSEPASRGLQGLTSTRPLQLPADLLSRYAKDCAQNDRLWKDAQAAWAAGDWEKARRDLESALDSRGEPPSLSVDVWRERLESLCNLTETAARLKVSRLADPNVLQQAECVFEAELHQGPANVASALDAVRIALRLHGHSSDTLAATGFLELDRSLQAVRENAGRTLAWIEPLTTLLLKAKEDAQSDEAERAFNEGDYPCAAQLFARNDDTARTSHCELWMRVTSKLRDRNDWPETRRLLEQINIGQASLPNLQVPNLRQWIAWCTRAEGMIRAVARLNSARWNLPEPAMPGPDGPSPYGVLHALEPPPHTLRSKVAGLRLSAVNQRNQSTIESAAAASACDALENLESRLLADFATYEIASPDRVETAWKRLTVITPGIVPGMDWTELAIALGDDMGLLYAAQNKLPNATAALTTALKARPAQPKLWHHLGVAAAAQVSSQEDDSDAQMLEQAWDHVIAGLGAVFADEKGFWNQWQQRRELLLQEPISPQLVNGARLKLQRFWLRKAEEEHRCGPLLDARFIVEIRGARSLHALGGLPLSDEQNLVAGLGGVQLCELHDQFSAWACTLSEARPSTRDVRTGFSQLGAPAALLAETRHREAAEMLAGLHDADAANPRLNPGFAGLPDPAAAFRAERATLLLQCTRRQAFDALSATPMRRDEAVQCWERALEQAGAVSPATHADVRREIIDFAIGRAQLIGQRKGLPDQEQEAALVDAVQLLEALLARDLDDDDASVRNMLAEELIELAIFVSQTRDAEKEASDHASRAFSLAPDNIRAIEVLAAMMLNHSLQLWLENQTSHSEARLREVEDFVLPELGRHSGAEQSVERIERQMASLRAQRSRGLDRMFSEHLEKLQSKLGPDPEGEQSPASHRSLLVRAATLEAERQFRQATDLYWHLVKASPADRHLRGRMAECYRVWLNHVLDSEVSADPVEDDAALAATIVREARTRCGDSVLFEEFRDG